MIYHKGVVNLVHSFLTKIQPKNIQIIRNYLLYSNYVFDAHIWEIYSSILSGDKLHVIKNEIRLDIKLLNNCIKYIDC